MTLLGAGLGPPSDGADGKVFEVNAYVILRMPSRSFRRMRDRQLLSGGSATALYVSRKHLPMAARDLIDFLSAGFGNRGSRIFRKLRRC
ncbi:hypothetical protein FHS20_004136 [Phyllobacterium endophyticum]|uniref:Uncharacterized protein n=1 Tax=Phyllobacterium endophyticum TaxID=1149773 RepID=A0A2P7AR40_9HYPH|nr:hypothetical protein [Phyllobacterium endophyticum]PSH56617.1 hypothetical protein CU100_14685 [Phyllobacterium endophyticum]TYR44388.1 hypothetical protein FY050_04490 [Phyllobacterium endophyticum]